MKTDGSLMSKLTGALRLKKLAVMEIWLHTLALVLKTNFGLPLKVLETLMFSKTKHLINASNSLEPVILKLPPALVTPNSSLLWKLLDLELGVPLTATGAMIIAMSPVQFHSSSLSQSLTLVKELIL